jgi:hypothetical protein
LKNADFYAAAAQVIPLIFLAIAFELRFLKFGDPGRAAGAYREFAKTFLPLLLFFIPGEVAALVALQSSRPSELCEDIVEVDLVWAVGYLLLVTLADWTSEGARYASRTEHPKKFQKGINVIGWVVTPAVLVTLLASSIWLVVR